MVARRHFPFPGPPGSEDKPTRGRVLHHLGLVGALGEEGVVVVFIRYGNDQQVKILNVCEGKWGQEGDDCKVLSTRSQLTSPTEPCSPELEPCATMIPCSPDHPGESTGMPFPELGILSQPISSKSGVWDILTDVTVVVQLPSPNLALHP